MYRMKRRLGVAIALCLSSVAAAQQSPAADRNAGVRTYNVRDYGAVGDGKTPDTAAVQAAIDACTKDQGGTVLVPAGVFVIGTVELKSNVTLHLASAAKLLGIADANQYHAAAKIPLSRQLDVTLEDGNWSLIYAVEANNVTVEGPGTIDGGGPPARGLSGSRRPYALLFYRCKDLTVRDITLIRCPYHIDLTFGGGGTSEIAANRNVPQTAGEYFQLGPIPAYGMYARNVKGLALRNVRFQVASPDLRPAVVFDGVRDAVLNDLSVQGNANAESALRFVNTQDTLLTGVRLLTPAAVFLAVEGAESKNIKIDGGDLSKTAKPWTADQGASMNVVKARD